MCHGIYLTCLCESAAGGCSKWRSCEKPSEERTPTSSN